MNKVQWHWIGVVIDYRVDNSRELLESYQAVIRFWQQCSYVYNLLVVDKCLCCVPVILINPEITNTGKVFSTWAVARHIQEHRGPCVRNTLPGVLNEVWINLDEKWLGGVAKGGIDIWD
jgi:hypothetical protein